MENWKNTRNYRKIRQDDESVKNIITVEGVDVEVTDEVFAAYSQADRKERYQLEDQKGRCSRHPRNKRFRKVYAFPCPFRNI